MQDVLSSVIQGINQANGLLESAAVSTAARFERDQKQDTDHPETDSSASETKSTLLPATGFTSAEVEEMRQNSSLGLEFDLVRQRQAIAEYEANATMAKAWQEATGRSFDRQI